MLFVFLENFGGGDVRVTATPRENGFTPGAMTPIVSFRYNGRVIKTGPWGFDTDLIWDRVETAKPAIPF